MVTIEIPNIEYNGPGFPDIPAPNMCANCFSLMTHVRCPRENEAFGDRQIFALGCAAERMRA